MSNAFLELWRVGKTFDTPAGPAQIVKDFSLRVDEGEFVCIIGHSGCGKSTVLSILMGLSEATDGGLILAGREISGPGLDRGVVFQSPALLPWLTVRDNVRLAVDQVNPDAPRSEREALADRHLELVGLAGQGERRPDELSSGMRQRVGIARAFALEPKVLLLDEPFSLLDALTRMELQDELRRLWEEHRRTVIMVTHDVDEALLLADRIVMMTPGPSATIGEILTVPLPHPRVRSELLENPAYFEARDQLISFLEGGAPPVHEEYDAPAPLPAGERSERWSWLDRFRRVVQV